MEELHAWDFSILFHPADTSGAIWIRAQYVPVDEHQASLSMVTPEDWILLPFPSPPWRRGWLQFPAQVHASHMLAPSKAMDTLTSQGRERSLFNSQCWLQKTI